MNKLNNFIVTLVLCLGATCCQAQTPQKVVNAFKTKFANASHVKWDKESETEYEAEFKQNGKSVSANFSADGVWLETESQIPVETLPQVVKDAFYKQVGKKRKIKEANKIEKSDGSLSYEIEYKLGLKAKEIIFDDKGNPIEPKKEAKD